MQFVILVLLSVITMSLQQPPGVPPRQQHPPHQGQQPGHGSQGHQQQQHNQQQQHHQQQQNNQQYQQQQNNQQQQTGHHHGHHEKPLEFASEMHNADHILEHLEKVVATKPKEEMTQEELEFHYFKLHDYDNNNQLDGVEIGKALTHVHDEPTNATGSENIPPRPVISDEELAKTVDNILNTFDQNKNGYVEYMEFKKVSSAPPATGA